MNLFPFAMQMENLEIKRFPIGKVNMQTGEPIYKPEYLEHMITAGTPIDIPSTEQTYSVSEIKKSSIKEYGAFYLYDFIAKKYGLTDSLNKAIPKYWKEIFTLACFLVTSGEPFSYCENWVQSTKSLDVGNMASQRISELLTVIKPEDRESFYQEWCNCRSEHEYLALDITSTSSYSSLIDDVEWGYNRDGEKLAQINICMLMGEKSRLPIYQTVYSGSLKDVKTLETTIGKFKAIAGHKPMIAVMDKGFYSKRNVNAMLNKKNNTKFIISVPFTCNFAKKQVTSERKDIDNLKNTIVIGNDSIRAITKIRKWSNEHKLYTHIYFNVLKAMKLREKLYTYVALLL